MQLHTRGAAAQNNRFRYRMATAEGTEGVETEKTPAERLYEAARDGDVAALDALLLDATPEQLHEEHPDENELGARAMVTPLFIAAWCEHEAIVRRLIAAGADAERGCSEGGPLMAAVAKNHHGCVGALLDAGADVNYEVNRPELSSRYRVIHVVVQGLGVFSPEIFRLLLSHGIWTLTLSHSILAANQLHFSSLFTAVTL